MLKLIQGILFFTFFLLALRGMETLTAIEQGWLAGVVLLIVIMCSFKEGRK